MEKRKTCPRKEGIRACPRQNRELNERSLRQKPYLAISGPFLSFSDPCKQIFHFPEAFHGSVHLPSAEVPNIAKPSQIVGRMWEFINMFSSPRLIQSSRRTSRSYSKGEADNGDFRSKAGDLASEKEEAGDNLAKAIWIRLC